MSLAEHIYRKLLWLYPKEHRRAYGELMVQHARDLSRESRERGNRYRIRLFFRLVKDGLVNAIIEQGEVLTSANGSFQPAPWLAVLLVALPGLWIAMTRRSADLLVSLWPIVRIGYILLMAIGLPFVWGRRGRFPVWGLLFAGALAWNLTYKAGMALGQPGWMPGIFGYGRGIVVLNITLAIILSVVTLRGRGVPKAAWMMVGFMLLIGIMMAMIDNLTSVWCASQHCDLQRFAMISLYGPVEGLMLVAVGLLAARQHGILATLVVVGGYMYMFMDTDYLFGYPRRDWSGLSTYLFSVSFMFLVVTPVALLRARTRLGQAIALFVPAILFLVARLVVPLLALEQTVRLRPGDVIFSINVLLTLILAWILYSYVGETARGKPRGPIRAAATIP